MDSPRARTHPWLLLALALAACPEPPPTFAGDDDDASTDDDDATGDDDDGSPDGDAEVILGPTVTCAAPVAGFDRFTEEGGARGFDFNLQYESDPNPCFEVLGSVVSSDLDGDGDPDVLLHNRDGFPGLFENDGAGRFQPTPVNLPVRPTFGRSVLSFAAVDLTGDALPDVVVTGADLLLMSPNLGGLDFGPWEVLWDDPGYPRACFNTQVWGDIDRDGDLDVVLPAIDPVPDENSVLDFTNVGKDDVAGVSTELLLLNDGGSFGAPIELHQGTDGSDGLSIVGFMTDRDHDGDTDLFIASDRPSPTNPPSAFFRNDGPGTPGPILVNDAASISADLRINGMGLGSNDLNGDGQLDYCMSDVSPKLACLLSDGSGGYYESGAALGLTSNWALDVDPNTGEQNDMSTWSVEVVDFENDGRLDVAAAAGGMIGQPMEDVIWQGQADGTFTDRSDDVGVGTLIEHFGMVADDFDGDGHRDLLFSGWQVQPTFWSNPCGAGGWIELKLEGPPGNTAGLGARVEADLGDRVDIQEIHALRSLGQSSPSVHLGLGDASSTGEVVIYWPDGLVTRIDALEANREVRVRHPDAP
jgi:hypothetical protein